MSICLQPLYHLYLENPDTCLVQFPASLEVHLDQVYRTQGYWNSDRILGCYGCTTDWWFYRQFHFYCTYSPLGQQFHLSWCDDISSRACVECDHFMSPPNWYEWTMLSQQCDPFVMEFSITGDFSPCNCAPDDCVCSDPPICTLYATITE